LLQQLIGIQELYDFQQKLSEELSEKLEKTQVSLALQVVNIYFEK
jgi:hypothetical protein